MAELEWIMNRAKKWIGPSNSSRKVMSIMYSGDNISCVRVYSWRVFAISDNYCIHIKSLCDRVIGWGGFWTNWKLSSPLPLHISKTRTIMLLSQAYVCDYVLTDPLDPHFQEVTSHLALYTMQIDGARKLHRHFIKRPDGCIVEVFGDVSVHLQKSQTSIERVLQKSQRMATPTTLCLLERDATA